MNLYTQEREPVKLASQPLGKGGSGEVFEVISPIRWRNRVAKIYYPRERTSERRVKLEYLIHYPPPRQQNLILWPESLLFEQGNFAGCLLPLAESPYDLTFLSSLKLSNRLPSEWIKMYTRHEAANLNHRAQICFYIASSICLLHQDRRYVHGDLKPDNFKVNLDQTISLLDTDSVAVSENQIFVFPPDKVTQEFSPPEIKGINPNYDTLNPSWDSFSMAVIFYKILLGLHPFSVKPLHSQTELNSLEKKIQAGLFPFGSQADRIDFVPTPHKNFYSLPEPIQKLFVQTFDLGLFHHERRPSALDWRQALSNFQVKTQAYHNPLVIDKPKPKAHALSGKNIPMPTAGLLSRPQAQDKLLRASVAFILLSLFILAGFLNYKQSMSKVYEGSQSPHLFTGPLKDKLAQGDFSFLPEGVIVMDKPQDGIYQLLDVKKNKMGYYFEKKEEILYFDEVLPFHQGFARVKVGHKWGVISNTGDISQDFVYDQLLELQQGRAAFCQDGKWGLLDVWKEEIIPPIYDQVHPIGEDLIEVTLGGLQGYCDAQGYEIVPPGRYHEVGPFMEGRARVKLIDQYGYINQKGEVVVPIKYTYASNFYHNRATVQENTPRGLITYEIDKNGRQLGSPPPPYSSSEKLAKPQK